MRFLKGLLPLVACTVHGSSAAAQQAEFGIRLREDWAIPVPAPVEVTRLVPGTGRILLHGSAGLFEADIGSRRVRRVGVFDALDIVGFGYDSAGIAVLDARSRRIVSLDSTGRARGWHSLDLDAPASVEITGAALSDCGWVSIAEPQDGEVASLVFSGSNGELRWATRAPFPGVTLQVEDRAVFVVETRRPFRMMETVCDDPTASWRSYSPAPPLATTADGDPWRSLSVFTVGDLRVRTFASISSDERVMAVYDGTGRLIRYRLLEAPLGLVTTCCRGLVLGVRRQKGVEIVAYSVTTVPLE